MAHKTDCRRRTRKNRTSRQRGGKRSKVDQENAQLTTVLNSPSAISALSAAPNGAYNAIRRCLRVALRRKNILSSTQIARLRRHKKLLRRIISAGTNAAKARVLIQKGGIT